MIAPLRSLRLRLLLFALATTALALVVAGIGISALFERHVERRMEQELDVYLGQLAGAADFNAEGRLILSREPANPRFANVYGGLYWQILDEIGGTRLRSRSLWDAELAAPGTEPPMGETRSSIAPDPSGGSLLIRERRVSLSQAGADRTIRIAAGLTRDDLRVLQKDFTGELLIALSLLGLVLLAAAYAQVGAGLRPLARIRQGVEAVRSGRSRRLANDVPTEIEPLVAEVNILLDAQDNALLRARDWAADLAHGLKTPLTALSADVRRLQERGETEIAGAIGELGTQMRRTVERELARSRARHAGRAAPISAKGVADAIARTLSRTPSGMALEFAVHDPDETLIPMDADDLHEVLGNLMENASRAARTHVEVRIERGEGSTRLTVLDDGPGMPDDQRAAAMARGKRQDEKGGAGLGLAIVSDILRAYGTELELSRAPLGGLSAGFTLKG
ncbi:sensor histidine kinase [Terrihabitans sp. B22-R8]|uniref:sensor histidine kinase n=1 Tax=Terrihabitans sp. B22-R8 TaxID=3425128 RepID=UPI00403CE018